MATIVARQLADGTLVEVLPDGSTRPMHDPTDWAVADALTDQEIEAAALADPDAQPLSDEALSRAHLGPPPRVVRRKLRLSREEFCARYQIPMGALLDWETRKMEPDAVVRAYMKVIMADPESVARTIARRPERPLPAEDGVIAKPRAAE
jgi:putative transcriptional regulator